MAVVILRSASWCHFALKLRGGVGTASCPAGCCRAHDSYDSRDSIFRIRWMNRSPGLHSPVMLPSTITLVQFTCSKPCVNKSALCHL